MINRGKLIPRSSKSNTVKSNSVSDLYVIKGAAIKVDNILKERLVLSKVREGILRQEEERRIRSGREMLLEKDVKNNYNVEDTDKVQKKKSGLGGLLGTVFKGILGSLGSVAFGLTPSLLGVGLVLKKLTNPFLLISGVALTALNVIVSKSGSQFKELNRKVNKDDISAGKIETGVIEFRNALLTAVGLYASGSLVGAGARRVGGRLFTEKQVEAQRLREAKRTLRVREAAILGIDPNKALREIDTSDVDKIVEDIESGRARGYTPEEMAEGQQRIRDAGRGKKRIVKIRKKRILGAGPVVGSLDQLATLSPAEREIEIRRFKDSVLERKLKDKKLQVNLVEPRKRLVKAVFGERKKVVSDMFAPGGAVDVDFTDFEEIGIDEKELQRLDKEMGLEKRTTPKMRREKIGRRQLALTRKFQRGMLRVSGRTFTKGAKSIIRNSVNGIPLIGDLIALLLDVFVFGEPVGRAAFMAVGSIIGGIIGGVAGLLGGPVMAMIGGLVGSISGDLLGAAFYDLIFRKGNINVADRFGNAITRGGFKAGVAGALSTGGFANFGRYLLGEEGREFVLDADSTAALENNYPGLLMALNKSDGAGAIELLKEYASYENEGRVSFVPIPIPSVSKPNRTETIVVLDSVTTKRSYSEHYRRG